MHDLQTILGNFLIILLVIALYLVYYAYRSNKSEFDLYCWVVTNRTRFALAVALGLLCSIAYTIAPEVIEIIGFNAQSKPIAIAVAIVGTLITTTSGNDPNK